MSQDIIESWEPEDIESARQEASAVRRRDPEAAAYLDAHVRAAEAYQAQKAKETGASSEQVDDIVGYIIDLHAEISEDLPWLSFQVLMGMHYPTFFRYVEGVKKKREKAKNSPTQPQHVPGWDEARLRQSMPQTIEWTGEAVHLGDGR